MDPDRPTQSWTDPLPLAPHKPSRAGAEDPQAGHHQPSAWPGPEKREPVAKVRYQKQPQPDHERFVALGQQGDIGGKRQDDAVDHQVAEQVAGHAAQNRKQQHRGDWLADAKDHVPVRRRTDHGARNRCYVEDENEREGSHALLYNGSRQFACFARSRRRIATLWALLFTLCSQQGPFA